MREGFKKALIEQGKDPRFQVLTGDHGYALFDEFRSRFPKQFHNVGVAESNLVTVAAGLARGGHRPLIYALAAFMPGRVFEFLKLQVAVDSLPVTVIGDGAGVVYSQLGHSHQSLEDLALANALPGFNVFSPSSDQEMHKIISHSVNSQAPSYIRIGKADGGFDQSFEGEVPKPYLVRGGSGSSAIVTHGSMTSRIVCLQSGLIDAIDLWSCPTISPVSSDFVETLSQKYKSVFVVEEHIEFGGLGSKLRDALYLTDTKVHTIGASFDFHHGVGSYEWTLTQRNLGDAQLLKRIKALSGQA